MDKPKPYTMEEWVNEGCGYYLLIDDDVVASRVGATVEAMEEWKRGAEEQLRVTRALELERDALRAEVERLRICEQALDGHRRVIDSLDLRVAELYRESDEQTARAKRAEAREKELREALENLTEFCTQSCSGGRSHRNECIEARAALAKAGGSND